MLVRLLYRFVTFTDKHKPLVLLSNTSMLIIILSAPSNSFSLSQMHFLQTLTSLVLVLNIKMLLLNVRTRRLCLGHVR